MNNKQRDLEDLRALASAINDGEPLERALFDLDQRGVIQTHQFYDDNELKAVIKDEARNQDSDDLSMLGDHTWGEVSDMLWNDTMSNNDYESLKEQFMEEYEWEEIDRRWGNYYKHEDLENYVQKDMDEDFAKATAKVLGIDDILNEQLDQEGYTDTIIRLVDQELLRQELKEATEQESPMKVYKFEDIMEGRFDEVDLYTKEYKNKRVM